ncbi:hypothetical protein GC173_04810 [bacterium]|nr:hypothetical protein [bacterium]
MSIRFRGRRKAIKELTHFAPDFVFWIYPDGRLHDARDAHRRHLPKGFGHILTDEPDYCGFLRGRVVSSQGWQLVVVYCRAEALCAGSSSIRQLLMGLEKIPVPLRPDAVVISDNADLYGTVTDLRNVLRDEVKILPDS